MSDKIDTNTLIVRHIVVIPDQPVAPRSIHLCIKGKQHKHRKLGLWNQYNKIFNMLLLSQPITEESLPEDTLQNNILANCCVG